jgi:hypothetical protein
MRKRQGGGYECALCGAVLDISFSVVPRVHFEQSGGKPSVRVLTVDGTEVHRCTAPRERK